MCEDCGIFLPDYGEYCKTAESEKCSSYEIIDMLREEYESIGICNTADLKEYYGEENYEWLGGYIRCAFLDPGDDE